MKRAIVASVLGIAAVSTAFGQGHVLVWNYAVAPYNQVYWADSNEAVTDPAAVQLQFYYALGEVTDANSLVPTGDAFSVNPTFTYDGGRGAGGYYDPQTAVFPDWTAGPVTLQIRATGPLVDPERSVSELWNPTGIGLTTLPAQTDQNSMLVPVFIIPEPSTIALAGLGIASLVLLRRKKA